MPTAPPILHAKTTDPAVIAAINATAAAIDTFREEAAAFARKHGSPDGGFYPRDGGQAGLYGIALPQAPKGAGRWKSQIANDGGRCWSPYANNPVSAEFEAIRVKPVNIPGLPGETLGTNNGNHVLANPIAFLHEGVAYAGFSLGFKPDSPTRPAITDPWEGVKPSEFLAVVEAVNEQRAAARAAAKAQTEHAGAPAS